MDNPSDTNFPGAAGSGNVPEAGPNSWTLGPRRAPPDAHVRSCAELKLWLTGARPGERIRYATGQVLSAACGAVLREYVMLVAEQGFLTPHFMRGSAGEGVWIVQRTRTQILEGQL